MHKKREAALPEGLRLDRPVSATTESGATYDSFEITRVIGKGKVLCLNVCYWYKGGPNKWEFYLLLHPTKRIARIEPKVEG